VHLIFSGRFAIAKTKNGLKSRSRKERSKV
jgi:hypothetical protein